MQIYEVGSADGSPYLALEWMDGGNLAQVLAGRPLPRARRAELVGLLARAVQAAHEQSVVHRDLKPANILFAGPAAAGLPGVPKVADFGLAKDVGGDGGQTTSATVLGTPGYMAPEQAEGKRQARRAGLRRLRTGGGPVRVPDRLAAVPRGDAAGNPRSGALPRPRVAEPASAEPAARPRDRLPEGAVEGTGPALRQRRCPRRRPARFLADRPVKARPVRGWEQGWRWCRRNPAPAGALGLALALLLVVAGVSSLAACALDAAQAETSGRLWDSLREQAHARRLSRLPGRREESFGALARAAALRPAPELRDDAIACLALLDVRELKELPPLPSADRVVAFDRALTHYAFGDDRGDLVVCRADDGGEVARLAAVGRGADYLFFSPDGSSLVVCQHSEATKETKPFGLFGLRGTWSVWDWKAGRRLFAKDHLWPNWHSADFTPDGKQLLLRDFWGPLAAYDLPAGNEVWRLNVKPIGLAAHPTRPLLALVVEGRVDLVPREREKAGTPTRSFAVPGWGEKPAWSPDGRYLAVPSSNGRVYLWDGSGELWGSVNCDQESPLPEYSLRVIFHPALDLIATTAWGPSREETTRLWDLQSGREEMTLPGTLLGFGADGRHLALRNGARLAVWEMLEPACRVLGASRRRPATRTTWPSRRSISARTADCSPLRRRTGCGCGTRRPAVRSAPFPRRASRRGAVPSRRPQPVVLPAHPLGPLARRAAGRPVLTRLARRPAACLPPRAGRRRRPARQASRGGRRSPPPGQGPALPAQVGGD